MVKEAAVVEQKVLHTVLERGLLHQAGPEVTVNKHFRCEVYLARQTDRLPSEENLNALGILAKLYY